MAASAGGSYYHESRCCQQEKSGAHLQEEQPQRFCQDKNMHTPAHTLAHSLTTHQVVQLNVGKGFYHGLGDKCGSITEEHGLKGEQRTV